MSTSSHTLNDSLPRRRRWLRFANAADCAADVIRLRRGHVAVGHWSLAQACWHLKESMDQSMHPPADAAPIRPIGWFMLKSALLVSRIPANQPSPTSLLPSVDVPASAIDEMLEILPRFEEHTGPFEAHPLGGRLSVRDQQRFNRVHCAHHLGFFTPQDG